MSRARTGAPIWYCPVRACPFAAGETEQVVLYLEDHCKPDKVIRRELERFRKAALNGGIACGKTPDDPEHPRNKH